MLLSVALEEICSHVCTRLSLGEPSNRLPTASNASIVPPPAICCSNAPEQSLCFHHGCWHSSVAMTPLLQTYLLKAARGHLRNQLEKLVNRFCFNKWFKAGGMVNSAIINFIKLRLNCVNTLKVNTVYSHIILFLNITSFN